MNNFSFFKFIVLVLKLVCNIIFVCSDEVIFYYADFELRRHELATLGRGRQPSMRVLDSWIARLNALEGSKSVQSPERFFATTNVCVSKVMMCCNNIIIVTILYSVKVFV